MTGMTTYIALLRGVNLGPHKRVAMADLRAALTATGFADVRTHLQSGNVVLASDLTAAELGPAVGAALKERLNLSTDVIVRTADQLAAAIDADPFRDIATDPSRHVIGFCASTPSSEGIATVEARIAKLREAMPEASDQHAFAGEHFYLWCPDGISNSPYFKVPWDKLGTSATQRNWNTATALLKLAADG